METKQHRPHVPGAIPTRNLWGLVILLTAGLGVSGPLGQDCNPEKLETFQYGPVEIIRLQGDLPNFQYRAGLSIDADGAPNAYHPDNKGLDSLKNAGHPGNWWGLVTDTGDSNGTPVLQGPNDPFPGFYISTTALQDKIKKRNDPARYVDARVIPYIVLPHDLAQRMGARLGDFGVVTKRSSDGAEEATVFAIYADVGPRGKLGEGSIALADALRIPSDPRKGGTRELLEYTVFPGSGNGNPRPSDEIEAEAAKRWAAYQQLRERVCH